MNERPSHLFIFPLLPPSCGVLFYTVLYTPRSVIYNWNNKKAEGFFVVFLSLHYSNNNLQQNNTSYREMQWKKV